jgi:hypothetical protein
VFTYTYYIKLITLSSVKTITMMYGGELVHCHMRDPNMRSVSSKMSTALRYVATSTEKIIVVVLQQMLIQNLETPMVYTVYEVKNLNSLNTFTLPKWSWTTFQIHSQVCMDIFGSTKLLFQTA